MVALTVHDIAEREGGFLGSTLPQDGDAHLIALAALYVHRRHAWRGVVADPDDIAQDCWLGYHDAVARGYGRKAGRARCAFIIMHMRAFARNAILRRERDRGFIYGEDCDRRAVLSLNLPNRVTQRALADVIAARAESRREAAARVDEEVERFDRMIADLSPRHRHIVSEIYQAERPVKQIARDLGRDPAAVRGQLRTALNTLRQSLVPKMESA